LPYKLARIGQCPRRDPIIASPCRTAPRLMNLHHLSANESTLTRSSRPALCGAAKLLLKGVECPAAILFLPSQQIDAYDDHSRQKDHGCQ